MNLFIDTNIFLSFFHLTKDDLEELAKLSILIREQRAKLWIPEQVISEFFRNRENKISESLKHLREQKLNLNFPALCKEYNEYNELRQLQRQYEQKHKEIINQIMKDVVSENLKADTTIDTLFKSATVINTTKDIIDKAFIRYHIGNPPGKNRSLGDAINWESLSSSVPNNEDLYFITEDKDYYSSLDDQQFNSFLVLEWQKNKNSKIISHRSLSSFFEENFPHIKLATELEKDISISDLASSGNFSRTHSIIAKLNQFTDFTIDQTNNIVSAVVNNSQISWIIKDVDVERFIIKVISGKEDKIDPDNLMQLHDLFNETDIDDDIIDEEIME